MLNLILENFIFLYCTLLRCINNYCELAPKIKSLLSGWLASTVVHPQLPTPLIVGEVSQPTRVDFDRVSNDNL